MYDECAYFLELPLGFTCGVYAVDSLLVSAYSFNGLPPLRQKPNYFYPPPLPHKQQSIFLKPVF